MIKFRTARAIVFFALLLDTARVQTMNQIAAAIVTTSARDQTSA